MSCKGNCGCKSIPQKEDSTSEWNQPYHKAMRTGFKIVGGLQLIVIIELAIIIMERI